MKFKILTIVLVIAIAAQFVPYGKEHINPPVTGEPAWNDPVTKETFFRVCGNCHSNMTEWPRYSTIAPISWLIQRDVDEGRQHFNVSEYSADKPRSAQMASEEVRQGEMPPWFYVIGHPEAKLSDAERTAFADGLQKTFAQSAQ